MAIIKPFILLCILFIAVETVFGLECGIRYTGRSRNKRATSSARSAFEPNVADPSTSSKKLTGRIVGGKPAKGGDFPWLVSIQRDGAHFCGGSIINPRWILSASHCFKDHETELEGLQVVAGASDYSTGDKYMVKEVITNEGFQFSHYGNDVSLLHLASPIQYRTVGDSSAGPVAPVCMPRRTTEFRGTATVAGWGFLSNGAGVASKQLMAVDVNLLDVEECVSAYTIFNEDTMLCAGYVEGKHDACQGDSGGPLVALLGGRAVQVGIVSYGEGCALRGKPGVYTRVSRFLDWIDDQINQRE